MKHLMTFAALILLAPVPLSAALIDFEDAAAFGGDDAVATDAYFSQFGVSFSAVVGRNRNRSRQAALAFERVGNDAQDAFIGADTGDGIRSGNPGDYFLKLGTGHISHNRSRYFNLRIDFSQAQSAASGEIWDIDGKEQFQVTAFNSGGAQVASLTSPVGGLDGEAFSWSLDSNDAIDAIEIEFTGQRVRGFTLDNFAFTGAGGGQEPLSAPLPPALPIALLGLLGVGFARKRRTRPEANTEG